MYRLLACRLVDRLFFIRAEEEIESLLNVMLSHLGMDAGVVRTGFAVHRTLENVDFPLWHIDDLDVVLPQSEQLEDVLKTLVKCAHSQVDV